MVELNKKSDLRRVFWHIINLPGWGLFDIEQLYYMGTIAASPFSVYSALVLYVAEYLIIDGGNAALRADKFRIGLYDYDNINTMVFSNNAFAYDSGVPANRFMGNIVICENVYLSRFLAVGYENVLFNGYRLILS